MKHEHLTIMFTDIKGFTSRTSKSSRKDLHKLLELHEELIEPVFHDFEGTVIKTIGDAFMVRFGSPTDAVLCGREIHRVLDAYNKDKDIDEKIEVRVAINSGECTVKGNDVFGETVNIAARLEGIADAGDIYFTEAVYLSMNKNEIPTAEVGYRHFKGVPDEVKVYKVIRESKKRGILAKKDKPVKHHKRSEGGWWKRNWKWVTLGVLIFLILSAVADKKKQQEELKELGLEGDDKQELTDEIMKIAKDVDNYINQDNKLRALKGLQRLRAISDKLGNPEDIEQGIELLQQRFDERFGVAPTLSKIDPKIEPASQPILDPEDPDTAELEQIIREVRRDIRDGDEFNARRGIDDLYDWERDGADIMPVINELERLFDDRFN